MKGYSIVVGVNQIFLIILLLLIISYSLNVEAMRPLKDQSSPSFTSLVLNQQAYSGPSHRGRGH